MAKEFTYRGKTLAELKELSISDFIELLPARQRRSLSRGFTESQKRFLAQIKRQKEGKRKKPLRTHCRNMIVIPDMVDLTIHIHRGKEYVEVKIQPEMVGHYLGEFTLTRNKVAHSAPGIGATKSSAAVSVK
jgi:small subunit ribosomal protein S19